MGFFNVWPLEYMFYSSSVYVQSYFCVFKSPNRIKMLQILFHIKVLTVISVWKSSFFFNVIDQGFSWVKWAFEGKAVCKHKSSCSFAYIFLLTTHLINKNVYQVWLNFIKYWKKCWFFGGRPKSLCCCFF